MNGALHRFPKIVDVPGWGNCFLTVRVSDYGWQVGYADKSGAFAWVSQDKDADRAVSNLERYLQARQIPIEPEQRERKHEDIWLVIIRWIFFLALGIILCQKL
jgi:hypothetical protein